MDRILPSWNAPNNIHAFTTTKISGFEPAKDKKLTPNENNKLLLEKFGLPSPPMWLKQIHSNRCIIAKVQENLEADAVITNNKNTPLAIVTADCMPILIHDGGDEIAAIHAGWRGLQSGIIENTIKKIKSAKNLEAWIGPSICGNCFEVGDDVWQAFVRKYAFTQSLFRHCNNKWHISLAKVAEIILHNLGVTRVYLADYCTYELNDKFYSYRRDGNTGRMATIIWMS